VSSATSQKPFEDTARAKGAWGVVLFAAVMLVGIGLCQGLLGLSAIFEDDLYVTSPNYTFALDVTTWGWIHLGIGVFAVAVGAALMGGQTWGRVAGIVLAGISGLSNFLFIPYYPIWSLLVIAFAIAVIWALSTQLAND
jgi:hypothetical protein